MSRDTHHRCDPPKVFERVAPMMLCELRGGCAWLPPGGAMFEHGVEDGEKLVHGGGERDLARLTGRAQAPIESSDDGVVAGCTESGHVKRSAHRSAAAPYRAFAAHHPAVASKWRHTGQLGDLAAGELT